MRNTVVKRTFIALTFNASFINKSYVDTQKKMRYLKPDPSPK